MGHHADSLDDDAFLDELGGRGAEDVELLLVGVNGKESAIGHQQQHSFSLEFNLSQFLRMRIVNFEFDPLGKLRDLDVLNVDPHLLAKHVFWVLGQRDPDVVANQVGKQGLVLVVRDGRNLRLVVQSCNNRLIEI